MATPPTPSDPPQARLPQAELQVAVRGLILLGLLLLLVAMIVRVQAGRVEQQTLRPIVMGTTCTLIAVGPPDQLDRALVAAQRELDAVNDAMSTYWSESELSRFNRQPAGREVALSVPVLEVLRAAERLSEQTGGAFDVTIRPLERLWREAGEHKRIPAPEELEAARRRVGFHNLVLREAGVLKQTEGLEVSLDAIAKGYAIHRAVEAMRRFPLQGALVDVGGDLECFGRPLGGDAWRVGLQHPRESRSLLTLQLGGDQQSVAVCTSGDYQRYVYADGKRYSHILDPRTGWPAEQACSVTVIAPNAMLADGWATALSVLGEDQGLRLLQSHPDLEALLLVGDPRQPRMVRTPGFRHHELPGAAEPPGGEPSDPNQR